MNRSFAIAAVLACIAASGCTQQPAGARIGELWAQGFAEAQTSNEPVPIVGLYYHGAPEDRKFQAEYYRARGWADGWRERHAPATGKIGVCFGRGYDDGVQAGKSMASRSFRPLPTEAAAWTCGAELGGQLRFGLGRELRQRRFRRDRSRVSANPGNHA